MIKLKSLIIELISRDLSSSGESKKYILVYKENLFILDDKSDLDEIKNLLKSHPGIGNYILKEDDVYQFMVGCAETAPDILVGEWYSNSYTLIIFSHQEIIPQTSLNVKKVIKQLGIKNITRRYTDSVKGDEDDEISFSPKKITGKIPKIMFHGTTSTELQNILKIGLSPGKGPSRFEKYDVVHYDHIFLAATFETATYYAKNAVEQENNKYDNFPIILELKVPDSILLRPDYDADISTSEDPYYDFREKEPPTKSTMKGMGISRETGKWGYKGRIPTAFIKFIYYFNTYQKKWHKSRPEVWLKLLNKYDWETIGYKLGMGN